MEKEYSYSDDTLSTKYRWIQDSRDSTNHPSMEDISVQDCTFLNCDQHSSPKMKKIHQLAKLLDDTQVSTKTIKKETILKTTHSSSASKSDKKMHFLPHLQRSASFSNGHSKTVSSFDKHMDSCSYEKELFSQKSSNKAAISEVQNDRSFIEPLLLESSGISNFAIPNLSSVFSKKDYQEVSPHSSLPKKSPNQSEASSSFSWSSETVKEYLGEILKQIYPDKKENIKPQHKLNHYKHSLNLDTNIKHENPVLPENIVDEKSFISKKSESILELMKEKLFLDTPAPNLYIDPENHSNLKVKDQSELFSNEKVPISPNLTSCNNPHILNTFDTHNHFSNKSVLHKDLLSGVPTKLYSDEKKYTETEFKHENLDNIADTNQKNQNVEIQCAYDDYKHKEDIIDIQNSLKQLISEYDRRGHMLDKLINEFSVLKLENKNQNNENALKISFDETKKHAIFVEKDLDAARLEIADLKTICHDLIEVLKIKPQSVQKYYPSTPKVGNDESLKEKMTRWKTYLSPQFSPVQSTKHFGFPQNMNIHDKKEPLHDLNIPVNTQSPQQNASSVLDKQKEITPQESSARQTYENSNQISSHEEIYNLKVQLEKAEQEIERLKSIIPNVSHEHHTKPITSQDMPDAHKSLSKAEKIYYRLQLHKIDKLCSNETSNLLKNILVQLNIPFDLLPETITSIRYQLQQSLRLREFAEEVHLSLYEGEPMDPKLASKKCLGDMITKVDQLARSSRRRRIRRSIV
ncbi:hypothetical protein PMAC_000763 [Pneumocystis sp. 'macacae']|nr:hypothetical protein PMAC_000763 [Pneumocystis sp. 'macacae']